MATKKPVSINRIILQDTLSLPTAPFAEHHVARFIEQFCGRRKGATVSEDSAGNLLVRVRKGSRRIARPVCITAHLDHPGFVADRAIKKGQIRAFWRGGVPKEYFVGSKVRFFTHGQWVRGTVRSIKTKTLNDQDRVDTAVIDVAKPVPSGSMGMWDFGEPSIRGSRIYARACDDLAGVAAMLCAIDELSRSRGSCDGYFLFTRAEEVGFIGAMAACRLRTIPKKCFVVAMETSSQLPNARMGDGPILRVGDRTTTFTSEVTAHCHAVARDLEKADSTFQYQRKLMDGGTCESSAYCTLGYEATGLCVALGNYHNVNAKRGKLGPEYIDLDDFDNSVKWFVELARSARPYTGRDELLRTKLRNLTKTYQRLLTASKKKPC